MLSRINEDDVREEIKSYNRQRDNGNYIERAINFNQQQERQKNQIFLKPNLMNQTARSDAITNTTYAPNLINQTARTDAYMNTVNASNMMNQTPRTNAYMNTVDAPSLMDQTVGSDDANNSLYTTATNANLQANNFNRVTFAPIPLPAFNKYRSVANVTDPSISIMGGAVASTPLRGQASSFLSTTPSPIVESVSRIVDAEGNRICGFCEQKFRTRNALKRHYDTKHLPDIDAIEKLKLEAVSEDSSGEDSNFVTPSNTNMSFENTGARPRQKSLVKPAVLNLSNQNQPDVTMAEQSVSEEDYIPPKIKPFYDPDVMEEQEKQEKSPVIIKFTKKRKSNLSKVITNLKSMVKKPKSAATTIKKRKKTNN